MVRMSALARLLLVVPLLAAGLAFGSPAPAGAARTCGFAGGQTEIITGTVRDSLVVPAGYSCGLDRAVIRGGVTVEPGGKLTAIGAEIRGPVTATAAVNVSIVGVVVRGDVTITGTVSNDAIGVLEVEIRGDLVVAGNQVRLLGVRTNDVQGDLVLRDNTVTSSFFLHSNVVALDLVCSGNTPAVGLGGPLNTVGGAVSPDCAGLVG